VTVGLVIVSHSAKLAEGVAELAAQMAPDVPIKPAGGLPGDGGLGTDFAAVATAVDAAQQGDGVLLLYDLGSARMTAELVVETADEPDRLAVAEAPLVEGSVAAAVAAAGQADLAAVRAAAEAAGTGDETPVEELPAGPGLTMDLVLTNDVGLHARPAAMLARAVAGLDAEVVVRLGDQQADARSVLALLGLAARQGDRLEVTARGPQAQAALDQVRNTVRDFG
jgi:PTS hybrid protein